MKGWVRHQVSRTRWLAIGLGFQFMSSIFLGLLVWTQMIAMNSVHEVHVLSILIVLFFSVLALMNLLCSLTILSSGHFESIAYVVALVTMVFWLCMIFVTGEAAIFLAMPAAVALVAHVMHRRETLRRIDPDATLDDWAPKRRS